jgi:hypothetical protein
MVWAKIRGPIGQPRRDYYTSFVAMHAGKPYEEEVSLADFDHPWAQTEERAAKKE